MAIMRLAVVLVVVLGLGLLGATVGWSYRTQASEPQEGPEVPGSPGRKAPPPMNNLVEVPSEREGVLVLIGSEIPKGEKVPSDQVIQIKVDDNPVRFRRLRVGDKVKEGQLLARVNDELARNDVDIAETKVEAAVADKIASEKTRDVAKNRYDAMATARKLNPRSVSEDEMVGGELTWQRYIVEAKAKAVAVRVAEREVRRAQAVLRMHEIRSPVNGVIRAIYKKRGEAVKNLEAVLQIEITEDDK